MATIEKRGSSYRITVSNGYDINGKQIREKMTWAPPPGMTERQIRKELERQAVLFEDRVRHSLANDGNIRLVDFTKEFMTRHARLHLKKKTAFGYEQNMGTINQALGHIKLKDLKSGHIASFYGNLLEQGIRARMSAAPKVDFAALLKERGRPMTELSKESGVSIWCYRQLKAKQNISKDRAEIIAQQLDIPYAELFNTVHDDSPLKPGTIHAYHRTLSAVLSRAVKWGYIEKNPADSVDLPSISRRRAAYLDEPDARRLLELLHDEPIKWRAIITFDLLSGLRRAEFLGLRWEDIDFDTHMIHIRQTWNYVPSQGCYVDTPKTDTSERSMKISQTAVLLLLEYKLWQDKQRAALGDAWSDQDGRVFTNDDGSPIFPDTVTRWFSKFVARVGLPKVTIHSLRHTFASLMIADGIPLIVVANQLGHAQASTTSNIYAHVIAAAEAQAAATFDRFGDVISPQTENAHEKKAAGI